MRLSALILLFCSTLAFAQTQIGVPPSIFGVPDALRKYLELTDTQTGEIMQIGREFTQWQALRVLRQAQLRGEILIEEKKSPLDPMALGLRYAEQESIRREVDNESNRVRRRLLAQLTDAQKQKVSELERARSLGPVIAAAECVKLLAPAPPDPITRLTELTSSLPMTSSLNLTCFGGIGGILPIIVPALP